MIEDSGLRNFRKRNYRELVNRYYTTEKLVTASALVNSILLILTESRPMFIYQVFKDFILHQYKEGTLLFDHSNF